ncbi:MAG TPA: hypothetical protein VFY29_07090 [Terriglobia bacterium]|nr:hypothetical protein [Terriglobia bacterium]
MRKLSWVSPLLAGAMVVAALVATESGAQERGQRGAAAPRGAAGQRGAPRGAAAPAEPAPTLADGKTVNLGRIPGEKGIWSLPYITNMATRTTAAGAAPARGNGARGAAAEPQIPFMPWSAAVYNYNVLNSAKYDPEGYCLPPGGPRLYATPYPMEIIQLPGQQRVIFIFEGGTHVWREVYMDGRSHPAENAIKAETWLGHSVGRYEDNGKTLVVDVVGFNEGTWLDFAGHPHTNLLHVVEKFTRPNKATLHYEAMIDDPGTYTRPWTTSWDIPWNATGELKEYICQENNRYLHSLKDDLGQPVF